MYGNMKLIIKSNPEFITLNVGTNGTIKNAPGEVLDKFLALKTFIIRIKL